MPNEPSAQNTGRSDAEDRDRDNGRFRLSLERLDLRIPGRPSPGLVRLIWALVALVISLAAAIFSIGSKS